MASCKRTNLNYGDLLRVNRHRLPKAAFAVVVASTYRNHIALARLQILRGIELERGFPIEWPDVISDISQFTVDVNFAVVIERTEAHHNPLALQRGRHVESRALPKRTFVAWKA